MNASDFLEWLGSAESLYRLCADEACPYDFAYRFDGSRTAHYHYVGPPYA